jgi:glycosyltransferase involved in cell wall biosynthesis
LRLPEDSTLRRRLGLEGATVLGFVGSFYGYEGLHLLLAALPRIREDHPDVKLLLVGGGPQEALLKGLAEALGVADAVVFTGRVPHHQVTRYSALVDIFAFPRVSKRLTELVTPLKPLEAMAQGRLVVASDVGGHRQLIRDGETGVLFPAGDPAGLVHAVDGLLRNRDRWGEFRQQARAFVENERTWDTTVAAYPPVYRGLVEAGGVR